MAASAADFLLETLYYEEGNSVACFSYTPLARSKVHNANLLGAAFLCRVAKLSGKSKYLGPALKAARYSLAHQYPDGSWDYGESDDPPQRWKDNFHTGYNLCALRSIGEHAGTKKFEEPIRRGFGFFREKFILADGTPRYYHDRTYPLDIHSAAQSIITLLCFKDLDPENVVLAQSVCRWAVEHLWRREGYFAFQEHRYYTNRIPYMRWSQAWMLQALSALLEELTPPGGNVGASRGPKGASAAVRGEVAGLPRYVLITPARNEVAFIEETIQSVVAQTVRPVKWVIVSDGSTDGTDEIVKRYAAEHDWIELLRMPERKERHFAGKVLAFNAGYERVRHLPYGFLACMDADISFQPDYFAFLLEKASRDSKLGVVGTAFRDSRVPYDYRFVSTEHVSGPCQVFRRECFEHIGGYLPLRGGGVDHVAVLTARMKGWKTRCFTDKAYHHRDMGSAKHGALGYKFVTGRLDYALGGHPLWELFRVIYQMAKRPWVFGGIMIGAGYTFAALTRSKLSISRELVLFRRREQMVRLKRLILGCPKSGIPLE
jgi:glycosyltransferase involved in cell wall biosynthesis